MKPWRLVTMVTLGFIMGNASGVYMGYNLPRKPTTEVNYSVGNIKVKDGAKMGLEVDLEIKNDTLSRKEKRKLRKK